MNNNEYKRNKCENYQEHLIHLLVQWFRVLNSL